MHHRADAWRCARFSPIGESNQAFRAGSQLGNTIIAAGRQLKNPFNGEES
jgi:hypothetical protein